MIEILPPGDYLALRRQAAGLTVADVAAKIATAPRLGEIDRADLIASIEADARGATIHTIAALRSVYPFSIEVVARLAAIADGYPLDPPRLCRVCGCSEFDPCVSSVGGTRLACCWSTADLCSACDTVDFSGFVQALDDAGPDDACAAGAATC